MIGSTLPDFGSSSSSLDDIANAGLASTDYTSYAGGSLGTTLSSTINAFGQNPALKPLNNLDNMQPQGTGFLDGVLDGYERYSPLLKGIGSMAQLAMQIGSFGSAQDMMDLNMAIAKNNVENQRATTQYALDTDASKRGKLSTGGTTITAPELAKFGG